MPPRDDDEAGNALLHHPHFPPYRDDPDEEEEEQDDDDDEDALLQPDAPISSPHRPSLELGHDPLVPRQANLQERIASRIPRQWRRAWAATVTWVEGPKPPHIYTITPIFPAIQHFPLALLDRYAPKKRHKVGLLLALYFAWFLAFALILWESSLVASVPGYGTPTRLGCAARYWREGNRCGLNGDICRPFNNATFAFRCPADCDRAEIFNPHAVGDREVVYQSLVVGGPTDRNTGLHDDIANNAIYRGDSFICASAIHAGFITASTGGCGVLTLTGTQPSFPSSTHAGITSTPFLSAFPHSFAFLKSTLSPCTDLRWPALAVTATFTAILALFTTSPAIFFWSTFVAVFFEVALASDPPSLPTYASLFSLALSRFLPACFCAWVTYRYTALYTLTNLTAQIEKTILYLGPAWLGALNNYTFDRIPIQRLTPHDIKAQPGAIPALIAVVGSIFLIALGQAHAFRREGRMPRYLAIYGMFVGALLLLLLLPGLNLRIHHYVLALLLLPGTAFQNRPSLIYQGLLLGLFINGVARWGFASLVETPASLLAGAQQGTLLPPISAATIFEGTKDARANITFDLGPLPVWDAKQEVMYDGFSVLVNDVERFRGYGDDDTEWPGREAGSGRNFTWTWERGYHSPGHLDMVAGWGTEYFRFAYMAGSESADFTKAGRWNGTEGGWSQMEPGPS